jgi:hypothetical protein
MAKLNNDKASATAESSSNFEPVEDGVYHARLMDVRTDGEGRSGPYWTWEYDIIEPGEAKGRKQWNNTSLADNALWKLKETFDAFGVPTDTDTDDLMGGTVKLVISQRVIQAGSRKGEMGNQVDRVMPKDEDFKAEESEEASVSASGGKEDIF